MNPHSTILSPKLPPNPFVTLSEIKGFSLLECVIAMFILALLATTVAQHQALLLQTHDQMVERWEAQGRK